MNIRTVVVASALALTMLFSAGCAVTRGQQSVGEYIDDSAITTAVKAGFMEDSSVATLSIGVETLNGTVMLSGFAKSQNEKNTAERIARNVKGVRLVQNGISVRP